MMSAFEAGSTESIGDIEQLEEMLSRPTPEVVDTMRRLKGDLVVLGVGGKIGPTLARMARRASDMAGVSRRIVGVARFTSPELPDRLRAQGIEPIRCDLLDRRALFALPDAPNVLYLAAMKFGSTGKEALTWAMNCYLPGLVCEKYAGSKIVAYSTGNVYGLVPVDSGGSREDDPLRPAGDYAMSCVGRERIFTWQSQALQIPTAIIRLNYAVELRYGVLVDIAQHVLTGRPVDLAMGYFNVIWQGDSNAMTLRAFDHVDVPPRPLNVTGLERLSLRQVAERFGKIFGKPVHLTGVEAADALLNDARQGQKLLGQATVGVEQMLQWIADWLLNGGATLDKPTHFEVRDGKF